MGSESIANARSCVIFKGPLPRVLIFWQDLFHISGRTQNAFKGKKKKKLGSPEEELRMVAHLEVTKAFHLDKHLFFFSIFHMLFSNNPLSY